MRDYIIINGYTNVSKEEAILGERIITFGGQHDAVYFRTGKDGTVYVFSKNGGTVAPDIFSLDNLEKSPFSKVGKRNIDSKSNRIGGSQEEKGAGYYNPLNT